MIFLTDDLALNLSNIENKISKNELLNDEDLKILLLNILQLEDSHENE